MNHATQDDFEIIWQAERGRLKGDAWIAANVGIVRENMGENLLPSDFLSFSGGSILSGDAVECLKELLLNDGETLPLIEISGNDVYIFLADRVDALDLSASEVRYFSDRNRIMKIDKYAFIEEKIVGKTVFRLPSNKGGEGTYYAEKFVDEVHKHDLKGFQFRLIWDSEADVSPPPKLIHPSQM